MSEEGSESAKARKFARLLGSMFDPSEKGVSKNSFEQMDPKELADLWKMMDGLDNAAVILAAARNYEGLRDMAMGTGRFGGPKIGTDSIRAVGRVLFKQLSDLGLSPAQITRWCEESVGYIKNLEEEPKD